MSKPKTLATILFSASLATVGLIALIIWHFNRPPFPLKRLDKLHPGMTKAEIETLLGTPRSEEYSQDTWSYTRSGSWPVVYISFDKSGRFVEAEYDY